MHNTVEKQEMRFTHSINVGFSMSYAFHLCSNWVRSLHQQSALTIVSELFKVAPVDG